jgi:hypothetical protein
MSERGWEWTRTAVRRHIAALPCSGYEVRLIEAPERACRAQRIWSAPQLLSAGVLGFLRAHNREGCDVYFRPWVREGNAGYVLLDFDDGPCPLALMRAAGQEPCVVVRSSARREQAWVRIAAECVSTAVATASARRLAVRYGADPASAEWRHLGRLAGFTNRKSEHRDDRGLAPWVRVVWTARQTAVVELGALPQAFAAAGPPDAWAAGSGSHVLTTLPWYAEWLERAGVTPPVTDWSVADYRVARALLRQGFPVGAVAAVLRTGSPGFPRNHAQPEDYLRRTVSRAASALLDSGSFSAAR